MSGGTVVTAPVAAGNTTGIGEVSFIVDEKANGVDLDKSTTGGNSISFGFFKKMKISEKVSKFWGGKPTSAIPAGGHQPTAVAANGTTSSTNG